MGTDEMELGSETRKTLNRHNLSPLWEIEVNELGKNRDDLKVDIWKWKDIRTAINQIANDLPEDFSRRVTVPVNASYGGAISHTIYVGIHTVSSGETSPAHRHSGNALKFTIDGDPEMKTTVGGEEFAMKDNDLVTTPQWEWHGHVNESNEEVIWLDILDMPLIIDSLNIGNAFEAHDDDRQQVDKQNGYYNSVYGEARPPGKDGEIPGPFEGVRDPTPPYRFRWTEMASTLEYAENNQNAHNPYDGVVLEYTNPARGDRPLFPTFGVRIQRLLDGTATRAHKHNATEVYHVIEGEGQTVVEGEELNWSARDIFVVPPSRMHHHHPDKDATLLNVTDKAMLKAINVYREIDDR
jgi:gentisate 1,2-dioxygenase